jgi:hypothetical protein
MHCLSLFALAVSASAAILRERQACPPYATHDQLVAERKAFVDAGIIPQTPDQFKPTGSDVNLIPAFEPTALVDVAYGTKAVTYGNNFSTLETVSAPSISFSAEYDHGTHLFLLPAHNCSDLTPVSQMHLLPNTQSSWQTQMLQIHPLRFLATSCTQSSLMPNQGVSSISSVRPWLRICLPRPLDLRDIDTLFLSTASQLVMSLQQSFRTCQA